MYVTDSSYTSAASQYISANRVTKTENIHPSQTENNAEPKAATSATGQSVYQPELVSNDAQAVFLAEQEKQSGTSGSTYEMETNKGATSLNLDDYYSNTPTHRQYGDLMDVPLLLPNAKNIQALTDHSSARFQQLLKDYNIPEAPSEITYNQSGEMVLPDDYPYADELKQALTENPGLAREMRDLSAITSHYVEIQKRMPMIEELQGAKDQKEIDAILAKYQHLLQDNGEYSKIALKFNDEGAMQVSADDKLVAFA